MHGFVRAIDRVIVRLHVVLSVSSGYLWPPDNLVFSPLPRSCAQVSNQPVNDDHRACRAVVLRYARRPCFRLLTFLL